MSLTQAQNLFAGVSELGVNDLLNAFFRDRKRHWKYGTPYYVPTTTATQTALPSIANGLIELQFVFNTPPTVDITPGSPPVLAPGVNEFVIKLNGTLTVKAGFFTPSATVDIYGLCEPVVTNSSPGVGEIGINVKVMEIIDLQPTWLEDAVEQAFVGFLQTVLANVRFPFNTITAGAFGLILLAGPEAGTNQIKVRGNAL